MPRPEWRHLYGRRWRNARLRHLRSHPLCAMCMRDGIVTAATVVDHITPHKGDLTLFWDAGNWQSLCAGHHNSAKQREERGGKPALGFTPDGRVVW